MDPNLQPAPKRRGAAITIILSVLFWGALALALFQKQAIYDWWRLRDYDPPAAIAQLASDTTMSDGTRRLFYVYHPAIEARDKFNAHCSAEFTIVLGCYISNTGIYLYKIDDPRLSGVEQVTAAHEVLHAAYERLSSGEREEVDRWTAEVFANLDNERIAKTVAQYRDKDASSVPNELHSILGTEVRDLPADLENYYKRYFNDRSKVVGYSEAYEAAFSSRQDQIDSLEQRLTPMGEQIKKANAELERESRQIEAQRNQLESTRSNPDPSFYR